MFEIRHAFFNPLWCRVLTVAFTLAWTIFELVTGSHGWALMFGAVAAWGGYSLLLNWEPVEEEEKNNG